MTSGETIVVGTDLSEASTPAVWQAAHLARRIEARLVLVHCTQLSEDDAEIYQRLPHKFDPWDRVLSKHVHSAEVALRDIEEDVGRNGLVVERRVGGGRPVDMLCEVASELRAALVVLGTHGRTGGKRVLLGSVAERAARRCLRSVLIARGDVGAGGYRRILVATDFERPAEVALDKAISLAANGAEVDILHCWQVPTSTIGYGGEWSSTVFRELEASERARAKRRGKALVEAFQRPDIALRFYDTWSTPIEGIQAYLADGSPYDLVAVATHGRRGLSRLLLGSVAEATIRYSPCSVLVARDGSAPATP